MGGGGIEVSTFNAISKILKTHVLKRVCIPDDLNLQQTKYVSTILQNFVSLFVAPGSAIKVYHKV
jgi:hypothetical protein